MAYYHVKYSIKGSGSTSHRTEQLNLSSCSELDALQVICSKYGVNPSDVKIESVY